MFSPAVLLNNNPIAVLLELFLVARVGIHPGVVVGVTFEEMIGQLHMFEATMRTGVLLRRHAIFKEVRRSAQPGLEVGLAQQPGPIAMTLQMMGKGFLILRQRDTVHPHAVRTHVLTGDHGRARGHADHILVVGSPVVDTTRRQPINGRCPGDLATVAAERVVAHLVSGDKEDVALHGVHH